MLLNSVYARLLFTVVIFSVILSKVSGIKIDMPNGGRFVIKTPYTRRESFPNYSSNPIHQLYQKIHRAHKIDKQKSIPNISNDIVTELPSQTNPETIIDEDSITSRDYESIEMDHISLSSGDLIGVYHNGNLPHQENCTDEDDKKNEVKNENNFHLIENDDRIAPNVTLPLVPNVKQNLSVNSENKTNSNATSFELKQNDYNAILSSNLVLNHETKEAPAEIGGSKEMGVVAKLFDKLSSFQLVMKDAMDSVFQRIGDIEKSIIIYKDGQGNPIDSNINYLMKYSTNKKNSSHDTYNHVTTTMIPVRQDINKYDAMTKSKNTVGQTTLDDDLRIRKQVGQNTRDDDLRIRKPAGQHTRDDDLRVRKPVGQNSRDDGLRIRKPVGQNTRDDDLRTRKPVGQNTRNDDLRIRKPAGQNTRDDNSRIRKPVGQNTRDDDLRIRKPAGQNTRDDDLRIRKPVGQYTHKDDDIKNPEGQDKRDDDLIIGKPGSHYLSDNDEIIRKSVKRRPLPPPFVMTKGKVNEDLNVTYPYYLTNNDNFETRRYELNNRNENNNFQEHKYDTRKESVNDHFHQSKSEEAPQVGNQFQSEHPYSTYQSDQYDKDGDSTNPTYNEHIGPNNPNPSPNPHNSHPSSYDYQEKLDSYHNHNNPIKPHTETIRTDESIPISDYYSSSPFLYYNSDSESFIDTNCSDEDGIDCDFIDDDDSRSDNSEMNIETLEFLTKKDNFKGRLFQNNVDDILAEELSSIESLNHDLSYYINNVALQGEIESLINRITAGFQRHCPYNIPSLEIGERCFSLELTHLSFDDALKFCAMRGGALAQDPFDVSLWAQITKAYPNYTSRDMWIGASDRDTEEGEFMFLNGVQISKQDPRWQRGSPSKSKFKNRDCLALECVSALVFKDMDCDTKQHFVCEYSKSSLIEH